MLSLSPRVEFLLHLLGMHRTFAAVVVFDDGIGGWRALVRWWWCGWQKRVSTHRPLHLITAAAPGDKDERRIDALTQLLLRAHFSFCQISLSPASGVGTAAWWTVRLVLHPLHAATPHACPPGTPSSLPTTAACSRCSGDTPWWAVRLVVDVSAGAWSCPYLKRSDGLRFGIRYS
jgi:hypothetical protein